MFKKIGAGLVVTTAVLAAISPNTFADGVASDIYDPFGGEWSLQVTPDEETAASGKRPFDEAILFHNGEFSAAVFAMLGFAPASYSLVEANGVTVFTAVLTSDDRGTLTWTGHLSQGGLAGELVWARPDGNYRYTVVGERPNTN